MRTYTREEILEAVREEIVVANKAFGISDKFRDEDYEYIGIVVAALYRLDTTPVSPDAGERNTYLLSGKEIDDDVKKRMRGQ